MERMRLWGWSDGKRGGGWREDYGGNGESRSLVFCSHPELLIFVHVHTLPWMAFGRSFFHLGILMAE